MVQNKKCSHCQQIKSIDNFHKNQSTKDELSSFCKLCMKTLYSKNILKRANKYYKKNRLFILKLHKNIRQKYPWKNIFKCIKQRCNNKRSLDYRYYGNRGIRCLITEEELKQLWFRDKAYLMKRPSIDRIDNNGHYTYGNCRFIENAENAVKNKRKKILQFDLKGNFIKEWLSIAEAQRTLKIFNIHANLQKNYTHAGNFIWKYK
jgi:hypothetical protein